MAMDIDMNFMVYNPDAPCLVTDYDREPQQIGDAEKFELLTDMCAIMDPNHGRRVDQIVVVDMQKHMLTGFDARTSRRIYTSDPGDLISPERVAATVAGEMYVYDSRVLELRMFTRNAHWDGDVDVRRLVSMVTDAGCATIIQRFLPTDALSYDGAHRLEDGNVVACMCLVDDDKLVVGFRNSRAFQVYQLETHRRTWGDDPIFNARYPYLLRRVDLPDEVELPFKFLFSQITCTDVWGYEGFTVTDDHDRSYLIDLNGHCIQEFDRPEALVDRLMPSTAICTQRNGCTTLLRTNEGQSCIYFTQGDPKRDDLTWDITVPMLGRVTKLVHCVVTDKIFVILYHGNLHSTIISYDLRP